MLHMMIFDPLQRNSIKGHEQHLWYLCGFEKQQFLLIVFEKQPLLTINGLHRFGQERDHTIQGVCINNATPPPLCTVTTKGTENDGFTR